MEISLVLAMDRGSLEASREEGHVVAPRADGRGSAACVRARYT